MMQTSQTFRVVFVFGFGILFYLTLNSNLHSEDTKLGITCLDLVSASHSSL